MSGETNRLKPPHAIVIGSGFGGLAAAIRLGARGYRVTVIDKLDRPGGRAYVHERGGHVFDAGPTVVTAPFLFEELWALCGKRMQDEIDLRPVTPFYRIRFDSGETFDYTGDAAAMRAEVGRLCPGDVDGYERFLAMSEAIFKVGFEKLADVPFSKWTDMARIVPEMMKLQSYRTVYGLVAKYVKDERLRQVLSFHPLLVGGNPFSTSSIYTLIAFLTRKWGAHFPIGGTVALVRARWIPRAPAVFVLLLTLMAVVPDQYGQLLWITRGVDLARAAVTPEGLAAYLAFEAPTFEMTASWAAVLYTLAALGWTACLAMARAWSRFTPWLTRFSGQLAMTTYTAGRSCAATRNNSGKRRS